MFHHFERRRCVSLAAVLLDHERREENRDTQAMGRVEPQRSAQRGRPAVPDRWTGRPGGSGAQPPLHLIYMVKVGRSRLFFEAEGHSFGALVYVNSSGRALDFLRAVQFGIIRLERG